MDLPKFKNGIFALKSKEEKKENPQPSADESKISFRDLGFHKAGDLGGSLPGLNVCLQRIYQEFKVKIGADDARQTILKTPMRVKIEDYKGHNITLTNRIEKIKSQDVPRVKRKVDTKKEDLSDIKKNPHLITGDSGVKASFYIGGFILSFLTLYLFTFYSSASYSAFFKTFTLNDIGVASSIFDAKAITKAFNDGATELALILTIPFSFLGLGYLIHKFQEQVGFQKYLKITMLIIVTFAFDSILAYEITEKIYNISKANSFQIIPDYSLSLAFKSMSFWLIIFAGFVVYIIWGFVFDFVMIAYTKMDKVNVAIKEKEKEIKNAEDELKDLDTQIDKMNYAISENDKEVNKLNKSLEGIVIPPGVFQHDISHFLEGWLSWMNGRSKPIGEIAAAKNAGDEFISNILIQLEPISIH